MSDHVPLFHSAVFVILRNESGEVLLQKRANTGFMDGRYDGSATGHIEPRESIHQAALRELYEEVGVKADADDLKLILIAQMDVDVPYLNFAFMCERWEGEPQIMEPEKNSEIRWCNESLKDIELTPMMALLKERGLQSIEPMLEYVDKVRQQMLISK